MPDLLLLQGVKNIAVFRESLNHDFDYLVTTITSTYLNLTLLDNYLIAKPKIGFAKKGFQKLEDEDAFEQSIVKSITQDDSIVSETLADLLHAQGQFSKALKMYQALILKFPEKTAFFAGQIEKLKNSIP
jgi:tetratricopeptide (TPR) repeat protein